MRGFWPLSCPLFRSFLCAKTSRLKSAWGKLMPGVTHWRPRDTNEKADGGELFWRRSITIEAGTAQITIASYRGKSRRHCRFKIYFSLLIG